VKIPVTRRRSSRACRHREKDPIFASARAACLFPPLMRAFLLLLISYPAFSQTESLLDPACRPDGPIQALNLETYSYPTEADASVPVASDDSGGPGSPESPGLVRRGVTRLLKDQEGLYRAPFQRSNFKWDAFVLAGTGALLATDRRIERHLPGGNVDIYGNLSNVALGGTAAALALAWGYGIKTHNEHLKETGLLEVEALVNTFLIYTPMQFAAGRQRPGEGNGYGDFGRHHNIDTSFPAGHPMFTITMASVVAHEYPKPWVEVLAYAAAASVMGGRLLGRDHWSSDVFVGSALGYFIGSHIFHSRCNPMFGGACHSH
jgi:membrane-associated phospholipid phosphatase